MNNKHKDVSYLHEMYNATSTDNPEGSDELETYESWLEKQLLHRINTPSPERRKEGKTAEENLKSFGKKDTSMQNNLSYPVYTEKEVIRLMELHAQSTSKPVEPKTSVTYEFIEKILRLHEPYSLSEVLKALIEASDILLHKKDYDGDGWERLEYAFRHAKEINAILERTDFMLSIQQGRGDAIEFAEWILKSNAHKGYDAFWFYTAHYNNREQFTSQELYDLFTQSRGTE